MRELLEGLWWIRRPMVNVYILQTTDGLWLIDTGTPWDGKALFTTLQTLGIAHGDLRAILLTHGDFDHMGSAAYLREALRTPVWVHTGDAEAVAGRTPIRRHVVGGLATRLSIALGSRLTVKCWAMDSTSCTHRDTPMAMSASSTKNDACW